MNVVLNIHIILCFLFCFNFADLYSYSFSLYIVIYCLLYNYKISFFLFSNLHFIKLHIAGITFVFFSDFLNLLLC
jgi:hypothetical protein